MMEEDQYLSDGLQMSDYVCIIQCAPMDSGSH